MFCVLWISAEVVIFQKQYAVFMEQGVGGDMLSTYAYYDDTWFAYLRDYYDPDITSTMFEAPKGEEDE